ncbi:hypothetical protein Hanom_Chr09g00863641 [Helianthus anomalus]
MVQSAILVSCWQIRRSRNEAAFKSKRTDVGRKLEEIKTVGLLWVKDHSKF